MKRQINIQLTEDQYNRLIEFNDKNFSGLLSFSQICAAITIQFLSLPENEQIQIFRANLSNK